MINVWCESDVGLKRSDNQDNFLINKELGLFIIADGMGGHQGGEVASKMAVKIMNNVILNNQTEINPYELLQQACKRANNDIFLKSNEEKKLKGMGTTLVFIYFKDNVAYIGNIGDSRAYLHIKNCLWQLTEDHSLVNERIKAGLLEESQIESFVGKNIITRSVGFQNDVHCDIVEQNLNKQKRYLLCTDGLSSLVSPEKICKILDESKNEKIVSNCIKEAKHEGGDDNVTVMFIEAN